MSRVIVATTPQRGHVLPLLSLTQHLKSQGYEIVFVTGSSAKKIVEAKGIRHVALRGTADYDATDVNQTFPQRRKLQPGPQLLDFDFRVLFIEPLVDQFRTILAVLDESSEPTVLITNHMFAGGWPFQLQRPGRRPVGLIAVGITPLMIGGEEQAPFGEGLPPARTDDERKKYARLRADFNHALLGSKAALEAALKSAGAVPTSCSFMDATTLLPDIFLQMAVPGLEYNETALPSSIKFIGAALTPQVQAAPAWWDRVKLAQQSGRPVIFVTQGTVARDLDALVYPSIKALADMPALIIATAGKSGVPITDCAASNVFIIDYLPYEQILPFVDIMITNGGYGGVQQALQYGIPLIIAGTSEDKAEVAARVAWSGAGINLKTDRPAIADIAGAVKRLLQEPDFRTSARRLCKRYQELDPMLEISIAVSSFFDE